MQFNNRMIERNQDGKLAIACHRDRIGWALYSPVEFFKGSSSRDEITEDSHKQLRGMRLKRVTLLAPGKLDGQSVDNTQAMLVLLRGMGVNCVVVKATDVLQRVIDADKKYNSNTASGRIREEMDEISPCPDDAAALALAVMFTERGGK